MYQRLLELISENDFQKINQAHILLVGVGGVGGFAFEALIRSGFMNIDIVDGDIIDISNLNRQIITNQENIGLSKVEEAKKRAYLINDKINISSYNVFLTKDNFNQYINKKYDYIIDACDDIKIKIELIKYVKNNNIKIISCLGTGRKLDPLKLEITSLNKTFNDPLAKKLRYELRKNNLNLNIPVIFSTEKSLTCDKYVGSAIFVPATAGILLANYIFNDILKN